MSSPSESAAFAPLRTACSQDSAFDRCDRMVVTEANSPRTVGAAGGATQEVQAPMPDKRNAPIRHGKCLACGDEWTERGAIVVCPECHSTNVVEVKS